ncbi:DUF4852 domain-containing protein [Cupriavidus oxalaticus]|uniref:DUF4852 domain-containing protein n=1 Tax=Cupriavidus oxalaticus TaxID=96344 RepID=A0A4P7LIP0_9BURK|nr:DUF4852 domain-containing protein [Cupriavidus oxalaticus]QBY56020.1 hypothetical protein E0W60_33735 [Cupriavidus oxalaticus]
MAPVNKLAIAILAATLVAACGKKDEPQVDAASLRPPSGGDVKVFQPPAESAPSLPTVKVDPARAYHKATSGVDLAYLYFALTDIPVDFDALAADVSEEYRRTTDTFKKKEMLDALRPEIQSKIAALKANPFIVLQADSSLGHYDLPSQSFPVKGLPLGPGEYLHFYGANYRVAISNGADFRQLKVADEGRARAMEAIVTNGVPGSVIRNAYPTKAEMFLYAQAADKNTRVMQFQLVQLKLMDEKGELVGEIH